MPTPLPSLPGLGVKPPHVLGEDDFGSWFDALAGHLLNGVELLVDGDAYRLAEVEAYYHGGAHRDPFSHRHPLQLGTGPWYFHRAGQAYRGGSFKGVDLSFGDGTATFGLLFRSIAAPDGTLIGGPSLVVD